MTTIVHDVETPIPYHTLTESLLGFAATLAPNSVSQRYYEMLTHTFGQLSLQRPEIARFFRGAMDDNTPRPSFKDDAMRRAFEQVVKGSTDAPIKADEVQHLSQLLYALYLLGVLFWLYDRTPAQKATQQWIDFMREVIKILRPLMIMPMFPKAMHKMTAIMEMVFE
jgi:hypothetical protein